MAPTKGQQVAAGKGTKAAAQAPVPQPPAAAWVARGLQKVQDPAHSDQISLKLPHPPISLGDRVWPRIGYGDDTSMPRWRVTPDNVDPATGRDLAPFLIRTRPAETIIRGLAPDAHPRSHDSTLGLGGLVWTFDSGIETGWNGLDAEQLYEYAFRCLEEALKDPTCREQFRIAIRNGSYLESISNVEDPLPPLPPSPKTNHFGRGYGLQAIEHSGADVNGVKYHFPKDYKRPYMTMKAPSKHPLTSRMFHHQKGTMGPAVDSYEKGSAATTFNAGKQGSHPESNVTKQSPLSQEYDPAKAVTGEAYAHAGGRIARLGGCKLVWFGVVLLVLGVFLCLFLFSFNIIKWCHELYISLS